MEKPQDLPPGDNQLYVAITLNLLVYILSLVSLVGLGTAAMYAVLDIVFTGVLLYLALSYTSLLPRFQQAFGAICGAGAVLNLASIPILMLHRTPNEEEASLLAVLSYFVLLVWSLSLIGHVLRHTFGIRMSTSIAVAVIYSLFLDSLFSLVIS